MGMVLVGVITLWRGRDDERLAFVGLLAGWAASMMLFRRGSPDTQWGVLLADGGLFVLCMWIALRSTRYWPLFVAAFSLLLLVTHLTKAAELGITTWAYLTAERIWSYLLLFTLGYAAWTAPRRYAEIEAPETTDPPGATRR